MKNMSEEKFPIESYLKAIIKLLDKNYVNTFNAYIKKNENFFADKNILMNKNSYKPISYLFTSVLGLYLFNAENQLKEKICFGKINTFIHDLDAQIKEIIFTVNDENLIKFLSLETKFRIKDSNIIDILIKSDISYSASFIIRKYVNTRKLQWINLINNHQTELVEYIGRQLDKYLKSKISKKFTYEVNDEYDD